MRNAYSLLEQLADGRFHSGSDLGAAAGVGRGAIWKQVQRLQALGVDIHAVRGKGYRLARPLELLSEAPIRAAMSEAGRQRIAAIEVVPSIDSTNRALVLAAAEGRPGGHACLAEHQDQGRGRRGRKWTSPLAANLYLSLLWRYEPARFPLSGLSLLVGVALCRALAGLGLSGMGLKWPNDVLWQGRKLAGVLIEMGGESGGAVWVVVGVGINVNMPKSSSPDIDQPWSDLAEAMSSPPSRNRLAARLLDELSDELERFGRQGPGELDRIWEPYDLALGRELVVQSAEGELHGRGAGVAQDGALLVSSKGRLYRFHSAEVSLRLVS